jgi:hypothetical protein
VYSGGILHKGAGSSQISEAAGSSHYYQPD